MNTTIPESILIWIQTSLKNEIEKITDEESKKATERIEERVRAKVGEIKTQVSSFLDCSRREDKIIIDVKFPGDIHERFVRDRDKYNELHAQS